MGDADVPAWLKSLPFAPEYRPTETEFADPIAFISRVEEEAAGFGICKVVPPIPKPSKKFVFHNLNRSLSKAPELGSVVDTGSHENAAENNAVFTTRHQELGSRRTRLAIHKQVWQSGELYTLEQFEAKSRAFARAHLGGAKGVDPLLVESMFWKAMGEKPVYIEYANDVPGSGFSAPKEPLRCCSHRLRRRRKLKQTGGNMVEQPGCMLVEASGGQGSQPNGGSLSGNEWEGSAGWKLSNSPWNLQVIARSPGSLTRFMPDEVPGVTSPMVYIGMLFSWFAWHVEDHELHSLNFLHTGSPKTWYAVPGSYASKFEEVVRMEGYGGHVDRLAAFTLLGEKTTLLSPEVIVESGIPCCRLVQHPGEFVVTFPRAYHVGFSHGFNCGEAANFATPKWLKVAKEAAVRRAAMNYLPMLSHQQLLYMLTMSFISRVPRDFLPGVRSSRLRDRKKEEREILVKKAFLDDLTNEHHLVHLLHGKDSAIHAVLWHPDLLPSSSTGSQTLPPSPPCEQSRLSVGECKNDMMQCNIIYGASLDTKRDGFIEKDMMHEVAGNALDIPSENISSPESQKDGLHNGDNINVLDVGRIQSSYVSDDGELPCDFDVDSGTLACVACGILGYPFMCVVQPSGNASELFFAECEVTDEKRGNLKSAKPPSSSCLVDIITESADSVDFAMSYPLPVTNIDESGEDHIMTRVEHEAHELGQAGQNGSRRSNAIVDENGKELSDKLTKDESSMNADVTHINGDDAESPSINAGDCCHKTGVDTTDLESKWNASNRFLRPRIFCLQHALEVWELLRCKGGAHVLIICHSDYLKIKAYALSVAEEIDAQLNCEDVPLKNASQADLDLVYVSIDDEEHDEDGEDWTAKMGLNLRYCVKLRKQSSSNQEQLTLGLRGIFSKQGPLSVISGLKWHCRKSRTHHKMIAAGQTRSWVVVNTNKDKPDTGIPFIDPSARMQVNKSFDSEVNYKKRRGRPRKNPPRELGNAIEASVTDDKTNVLAPCSSTHIACGDEVLNDGLCNLASSTYLSAPSPEDNKAHEQHLTLERKEVKSSFVVGDSARTEDSARCSISAREVAGTSGDIPKPTTSAGHLQGNENSSGNGESSANYDVGYSVESECPPSTGAQTIASLDKGGGQETQNRAEIITAVDSAQLQDIGQETQTDAKIITTADSAQLQDIGQETQTEAETITAVDSVRLQDVLTTAKVKEVCSSNILDDQPNSSTTIVEGSELRQERAENSARRKQEKSTVADTDMRIEDASSEDMNSGARISSSEVSEMLQMPNGRKEDSIIQKFDLLQGLKQNGVRNTVQLKYERRRKKRQGGGGDQIKNDSNPSLSNKRKREVDQITSVQLSCNGFIRSPCEGLRPRSGRAMCEKAFGSALKETSKRKGRQRGDDDSVGHKDEDKSRGPHQCNLQGCHMSFQTGRELSLHKRNRCTYEGCGKRFISHKYAMRHQCVHDDERPLRCPWKGCNVTFKWAWARTEHVRVHTGERPYKCKASGCGLTFRFVSDFSRHRRKTGHSPS